MKQAAVVSEKGQVTIPKRLRERLGLVAGSVVAFEERQGRLVGTRVVTEDPIARLVGLGTRRGVSVDEVLTELRGPSRSRRLDR